METFKLLFHFSLVVLCVCVDQTNAQELHSCSSNASLCGVSYFTWPIPSNDYSKPTSQSFRSICRCPGDFTWSVPDKFLSLELILPEKRVTATLFYCDELVIPERTCNKTEIAVTLFGSGPVPIHMVGNVKCHCTERLSLVKTMHETDGHSYIGNFTCGKPTCDVCKSDPPACERVTPQDHGWIQVHELPCRCPDGYICHRDLAKLPISQGEVKFYCKQPGNTTDLA